MPTPSPPSTASTSSSSPTPWRAAVDAVTGRIGKATLVGSPEALLDSGVDGVVIAAVTGATPSCCCVGQARLPTFCEKPIAAPRTRP